MIEIPDSSLLNNINSSISNQIINSESNKIIQKMNNNSYNIALDSHGIQYTSEEFASLLNQLQNNHSEISFIVGGSLGLSEELKKKCNSILSFSKMTFPHQMIRVFLLEQIFRAFKILSIFLSCASRCS